MMLTRLSGQLFNGHRNKAGDLVKLPLEALKLPLELGIRHGMPVKNLAEHLGIGSSVASLLPERPVTRRVYMSDPILCRLFQPTRVMVPEEVTIQLTGEWYCASTRVLLYFARRFDPIQMPYLIAGLGSYHGEDQEGAGYPCLEAKEGVWTITLKRFDGDADITQAVVLAWK
jgi:hypothetical protein